MSNNIMLQHSSIWNYCKQFINFVVHSVVVYKYDLYRTLIFKYLYSSFLNIFRNYFHLAGKVLSGCCFTHSILPGAWATLLPTLFVSTFFLCKFWSPSNLRSLCWSYLLLLIRIRGVMVSALDFYPGDRGSIPRQVEMFIKNVKCSFRMRLWESHTHLC